MKLFLLSSIFLILAKCSHIVNLNVGGKIFTTYRSTLEKAGPDTYFYKLFNSEMSKKTLDDNGNIFLDHDPDTFGLLLNLLRGYDVLKGKTQDQMTMLYQDANFFGMTDLMERIVQLPDEFVNTDSYRGGMKRKEKHGYGFEKTADGYYEGDYVEGKRHGQGILSDSKGIYNGEFKEEKRDGKGEFTWDNGDKFIGYFKDDQAYKGQLKFSSGDFYEGEFKDGLKHGKGRCVWPDGRIYEGDWQNGKAHGFCKYQTKDFIYEGELKERQFHGKGKKIYKDGKVEEGNWENGIFKGNQ